MQKFAVFVTKASDEIGAHRVWITKDLDSTKDHEVIREGALWTSQLHKGTSRPAAWSTPNTWVASDEVVDCGIFLSDKDDDTASKRAISSAYRKGARGTMPAPRKTAVSRISRLPHKATWGVPVVLPTTPEDAPSSASKRPMFKQPDGTLYVGRWMPEREDDEQQSDVAWVQECAKDKASIFFYGKPGCGKSVLAITALKNIVTVLGNERTEQEDFVGRWEPDPSVPGLGARWVPGPLWICMENGWPLFIDEIGKIDPRALTAVFSAMDSRREIYVSGKDDGKGNQVVVKAKPGFIIMGATNPRAPGVVLDEALLSRFEEHIDVQTDYDMMRDHLGAHPDVCAFAAAMNAREDAGDVDWSPQAREVLQITRSIKRSGIKHGVANLIGKFQTPNDREVAIQVARSSFGFTPTGPLALV